MRTRTRHLLTGVLAVLFALAAAPALTAQEESASITEMIRLEVPVGQQQAFEEGLKAHHEVASAQGVDETVIVWQVVTGKHSGDFYIGFVGRSWADFDRPMADDPEAMQQSIQENIAPHVSSYETTFWRHRPEMSYHAEEGGGAPDPLMTVTFFYLDDPGAMGEVAREITRVAGEADFQGDGWDMHTLEYGGGAVWALAGGRENWADLAEPETTLWSVLSEHKSEHEMDALEHQLDKAIDSSRSEVFRFREDLSHMPGMDEGEGEM